MDPFPTKGIEYLLIIGYLLVFVPFAWLLSRIGRDPVAEEPADGPEAEPLAARWFRSPEAFHFHRGHSWAHLLGGKLVKIGMDDFAHRLIGTPTAFRLPEPGHRLEQGDVGWRVHVNGDAVELLSPVDGEVVEVNQEVLREPALATEDPYGQGWLLKVRVPSDRRTARNLLTGRLAKAWMLEEEEELSALVAGETGPVLQDGGVPVHGFARELVGKRWTEIAARFLLTGPDA